MKKSLLLILCLSSLLSCGPLGETINLNPISKIVQTNSQKEDLFVKSNIWVARNFGDAESVIRYSDKEAGIIVGKFIIIEYTDSNLYSMITIQVKDNISKIIIEPESFYEGYAISKKDKILEKVNELIASYADFIKTDSTLKFYD